MSEKTIDLLIAAGFCAVVVFMAYTVNDRLYQIYNPTSEVTP